ncbi:MAG: zinc ribbon domain-containing protein [Chthonomonadales bacterium]|nr:zinc ribbon domain-containing protein [Chthonomonadales bacterium]
MPIYEFRCADCALVFDTIVRTATIAGVVCPNCGSRQLTKLISAFAVSRNLAPCGRSSAERAEGCGSETGPAPCAGCCERS